MNIYLRGASAADFAAAFGILLRHRIDGPAFLDKHGDWVLCTEEAVPDDLWQRVLRELEAACMGFSWTLEPDEIRVYVSDLLEPRKEP